MTNTSLALRRAVHFTLAAVATTAGGQAAYAQSAPSSTAPAESVQEVVVTGSRIQQAPNDVSISPVTSVTALDIQQTGLTRTEDLLNNLPQVIAEQSSGTSISSNGTATVSLRGLGSWRTLALVNGRRLSPGAALNATGSASASADINQIPAALLERVDVLTGGASAVYGADAVAGVVNFVLNTKYEGVKVDMNYAFANHKNNDATILALLKARNNPAPDSTVNAGYTKDVSVLAGANFADGKGNATAYFTYLNQAPVVGKQYDYAGCTLNSPPTVPTLKTRKYACGGSSSSATGRFLLFGSTANSSFATLGDLTVDPAGGFRNYSSARDSYNYGALSFLQRQAERYTGGVFLNYDINEHTNVYNEFMFSRNTSTAQYGPSGLFAFGTPIISCDNPLFSDSQRAALCSPANVAANQALFGSTGNTITLYAARRSVESGPRLDNYSANAFREVLGLRGKWNDAWSYDVYGQLSISNMQNIEGGFLGANQINYALNAIPNPAKDPNDPTKGGVVKGAPIGAAVCQVAVQGIDPACVPWNIWTPGGVTADQLKYLTVASSYVVKTTEYVVSGSTTGQLEKYGAKLPTAASGLIVNIGAEYRQEKYDFDPDYIFGGGLASGGNGAFSPIHGGFHVAEAFTEMRLPIVDEKPGIYQLSAEAGYRFSDYTSGFRTNTYKFGLEYAPIQDVRVRAGYNRAVRAPSLGDLFTPQVIGAGGNADPCWGTSPTKDFTYCARTGVTQNQYGNILPNPAAQINTAIGGNLELTPEVADTYTFGFVAQPRFAPSLVVSVDYYNIKIKNTIQSLTADTVLDNCGNTGSAATCSLIHRGAGTGSLWFNNTQFIDVKTQNIGTVATKGIDLAAHYRLDIGRAGKLGLNLSGTHVQTFTTQPLPTSSSYDCVGYYGTTCGAPTPKWRHVFVADWMTPWAGLSLTMKWRYIGSTATDRSSPDIPKDYYPGTKDTGSFNYIDLSASMPITTGIDFRLGVNNITDKDPPIILNGNYSDCPNNSCNDNTWVGTFDTLGRYIYAHLSAKF